MIRALLLCVLLTGCDSEPPKLKYPGFVLTIHVDPALATLGHAQWVGQPCTITLREYPVCLQHEVRHCLEGKWHGDDPSGEDCQ